MELYYLVSVVDRPKVGQLLQILKEQNISFTVSNLGQGTATKSVLDLHELEGVEKTVVNSIASGASVRQIMRAAKRKMFIDIPGNGIMFSIPIKSVCGSNTLKFITEGQKVEGTEPDMNVSNELIIVILNEGYSDMVMDAAREAGATGGTVLHAKGTGKEHAEKFYGVTIAEEKDMIYILAPNKKKSAIMKAINENCGVGTKAGAVSFSLPVSEVCGIRRIDD